MTAKKNVFLGDWDVFGLS